MELKYKYYGAVTLILLFFVVGCDGGFKISPSLNSPSVVDSSAVPQVSIDEPGNQTQTKGEIQLSGACISGMNVDITGDIAAPLSQACADGHYAVKLSLTGADGAKTIQVRQVSSKGLVSSFSRVYIKDTLAPIFSIVTPTGIANVKNNVIIQGACETGINVNIVENARSYNAACINGAFGTTLPLSSADGPVVIDLSQTDVAGNRSALSLNVTKDTVLPVLTITAPGDASQVTSSANIVGACESGLQVLVTGSGVEAPASAACAVKAYSIPIVFTAGAGIKTVQVSQTDAAGNIGSISRNFNRQAQAGPVIAVTAPAANSFFKSTLAVSGTCQTGLPVVFSGSGWLAPANTACNAGAFSASISFTNGDGPKNLIASQTNTDGVTGSASRTFVRDTFAPAVTIASPVSNSSHKTSIQLMGACENGLPIQISGTGANATTAVCGNGAYSSTVNLSTGDGNKIIQVAQTDAAGNSGSANLTVVRDTVAPVIKITAPALDTAGDTGLTISGTCDGILTVTASGSGLQSTMTKACAAGAYSIDILFSSGDGTKAVQVSQTDTAGNVGIDTRNFMRVTSAPVLDGVMLYTQNCSSCHGALNASAKLNRTVAQISSAISTISQMTNLAFLTTQQRQAIANALVSTNNGEEFPYLAGKYLPVDKALTCDPNNEGVTNNSTRRLSKQQMINSIVALFGQAAVNATTVQATLPLLPADGPIGLVEGFDNSINYVEGLMKVAEALVEYTFASSTRIGALLPTCQTSATAQACKDSFLAFAKKALRHPLTAEETTSYLNFIASYSTPQDGLKNGVVRVLMAPRFHNHFELGETATSGARIKIDSYDLASRLAFGISNAPPDATLMSAADNNQLQTLDQLKTHATRLVGTTFAKQYFKEFLISWLAVESNADPNPLMKTVMGIDPVGFTTEMRSEFDRFVDHVVFDLNGTFNDLMTAKFMFPSTARLSQFLGATQTTAAVSSPAYRGGILLRPLVTKSGKMYSAPIPRGVLLRRQVLCTNLPSPDSNIINTRLSEIGDFPHSQYSNRSIVTNITDSQTCMGCHAQINPLGFAMENFGPFGEYRTVETIFNDQGATVATHAIDASVTVPLPGRAPAAISSVPQLAQEIAGTPAAMRCYTQQVFRFTR